MVTAQAILGKKVLIRMDLDLPIEGGKVIDGFRLEMGFPTLRLCLEHAREVIVLGHIGRPGGRVVPALSVKPIWEFLELSGFGSELHLGKLKLLDNLRFEAGEDQCDAKYAKQLALLGEIFVNESFAAYHKSSSVTLLPKLLPSFAGLHFLKEVSALKQIRDNPKHPLLVIIGGAKIMDKLGVVKKLAGVADNLLIGGKLPSEIKEQGLKLPDNVLVADMIEDGLDITPRTLNSWSEHIKKSKMIVWNGPMGKIETSVVSRQTSDNNKGTYELAKMILKSKAEVIIGGGDTVGFLQTAGLLDQFMKKGLVSTGGGAMLKFLEDGTLPSIEALN